MLTPPSTNPSRMSGNFEGLCGDAVTAMSGGVGEELVKQCRHHAGQGPPGVAHGQIGCSKGNINCLQALGAFYVRYAHVDKFHSEIRSCRSLGCGVMVAMGFPVPKYSNAFPGMALCPVLLSFWMSNRASMSPIMWTASW